MQDKPGQDKNGNGQQGIYSGWGRSQ